MGFYNAPELHTDLWWYYSLWETLIIT